MTKLTPLVQSQTKPWNVLGRSQLDRRGTAGHYELRQVSPGISVLSCSPTLPPFKHAPLHSLEILDTEKIQDKQTEDCGLYLLPVALPHLEPEQGQRGRGDIQDLRRGGQHREDEPRSWQCE